MNRKTCVRLGYYNPKEWRRNAFWKQNNPMSFARVSSGGGVLDIPHDFSMISQSKTLTYPSGNPVVFVGDTDVFKTKSSHWFWAMMVDVDKLRSNYTRMKAEKGLSQHQVYEMVNEIGYGWMEYRWISKNFSIKQWYENTVKTSELYKQLKPITRNLDSYLQSKEDTIIWKKQRP